VLAVATAVFAFAGALYFSFRDVPRLMVIYFFVLDLGILAGWRLIVGAVIGHLQRHGRALSRVLVVGAGEGLEPVARALRDCAIPGLKLVGVAVEPGGLGPERTHDDAAGPGVPVLGRPEDVPRLVLQHKIDEVILAFPAADFVRVERIAYRLLHLPVRVRLVPDLLGLVVARSSVESLAGIPLIGLREPVIEGLDWMIKRTFDLLVSLVVLMLSWPLMAVIAVLIRLDSRGPILFRQKRVGENGRIFTILKFRTMVTGSDHLPKVLVDGDGHRVYKLPDDPRITRIGRFLRRTSLDELPNFVNVFKGEMSLVGPRPELLPIADTYEPWQRQRLAVQPGMTGWWQVNGRSDLPLHENTEHDLYYVRNYSLWLDLKILFKTVGVVVQGKGAY
jgi:exopolysaccharide biosynthesis polyprenyl glycosylphosphotransferase